MSVNGGVVRKQNIPWGSAKTIELDERQSKMILQTCRRFIMWWTGSNGSNGGQDRFVPNHRSWFHSAAGLSAINQIEEKRLRADGRRMPQKLQLRNLRSMNVFLDPDEWLTKLPRIL